MADSDQDWRDWGETEPYFGVLSDERFQMASIAENRDAFFTLGQATVEERLATAEQHFGPFARGRALDFGCGVGRLSIPLAAKFGTVQGLDIAPAMLAEARANADALAVGNLDLALSDDALSRAQGPCNFVMSALVLQHIPVRRGLGILARLLELTASGGVLSLQICVGRPGSRAARLRYWAQCHVPGVHMLFNLARGRRWREPLMQMNPYPLNDVLALVKAADFGPCLIDHHFDGRFATVHILTRRR